MVLKVAVLKSVRLKASQVAVVAEVVLNSKQAGFTRIVPAQSGFATPLPEAPKSALTPFAKTGEVATAKRIRHENTNTNRNFVMIVPLPKIG
jgi:hypothetical protein